MAIIVNEAKAGLEILMENEKSIQIQEAAALMKYKEAAEAASVNAIHAFTEDSHEDTIEF